MGFIVLCQAEATVACRMLQKAGGSSSENAKLLPRGITESKEGSRRSTSWMSGLELGADFFGAKGRSHLDQPRCPTTNLKSWTWTWKAFSSCPC